MVEKTQTPLPTSWHYSPPDSGKGRSYTSTDISVEPDGSVIGEYQTCFPSDDHGNVCETRVKGRVTHESLKAIRDFVASGELTRTPVITSRVFESVDGLPPRTMLFSDEKSPTLPIVVTSYYSAYGRAPAKFKWIRPTYDLNIPRDRTLELLAFLERVLPQEAPTETPPTTTP